MRNPFKRRNRGGLGVLERGMFSVMGPPQLGENRPPAGYVPDPAADLCGKCGRPWVDHKRVDTGSMTYRRCPPPPAAGVESS